MAIASLETSKAKPLSIQQKAFAIIIFSVGVFFLTPGLMPIAIVCGGILLFQKKSKAIMVLGFLLLCFAFIVLIFYLRLHLEAGTYAALISDAWG